MKKEGVAVVWLQNDFRLEDNIALTEGASYQKMIAVFIWNDQEKKHWTLGSASKCWLHHTIESFQKKLANLGSRLVLMKGSPEKNLLLLAKETKATHILWNDSHNPIDQDQKEKVFEALKKTKIKQKSFRGSLLCSKDFLCKKDGSPYLVYTPFWNNFIKKYQPEVLSKPSSFPEKPTFSEQINCDLKSLNLLPKIPWDKSILENWQPGEDFAQNKLTLFLKKGILTYSIDRDLPSKKGTSKLSPHLHFGEIHPQRILNKVIKKFGPLERIIDQNVIQFCKEIIWREFSYHLLQHFPKTTNKPLREKFSAFPWKRNKKFYTAWTKGSTGYPLVDAGMRELWQTGWMHNRVRMITASFLIKHLNISWQEGAQWFWDTLVDADLASNTQGWQWVAGCGADASPYFRIFNPITQGEKFDKTGQYIKKWCPELKNLPLEFLNKPWEAPSEVLNKSKVVLGENYPHPIVDHKTARQKALWNYEWLQKK